MTKSFPKFLPLANWQAMPAFKAPSRLSGVGKVLADIYAKRSKPLIRLPKQYDYQGKPSFVAASKIMTDGQIRDVNGEVWQAEKLGAQYVATA